jgi:hypothetical protein
VRTFTKFENFAKVREFSQCHSGCELTAQVKVELSQNFAEVRILKQSLLGLISAKTISAPRAPIPAPMVILALSPSMLITYGPMVPLWHHGNTTVRYYGMWLFDSHPGENNLTYTS